MRNMNSWLQYHEDPIELHSGGKSHWLIDGDVIFKDPHLRRSVLRAWGDIIQSRVFPHPYFFVGIPRGGMPWAEAMASYAGQASGWGTPNDFIAGTYKSIFLVDDIVTTGASLTEAKNVLKAAGKKVTWRFAVVIRPPTKGFGWICSWATMQLETEDA